MANIKSAKKRISVIAKKTAINKSRKSALKTAEKRVMEAVATGVQETAVDKLKLAEKKIRQAAAAGTIHKNAAARKVSRLQKKLNEMVK